MDVDHADDEDEDDEDDDEEKWQKLEPFLERVTVYAKALKEQMDSAKYAAAPSTSTPRPAPKNTRKRPRESVSDTRNAKVSRREDQPDVNSSRNSPVDATEETQPRFTQPILVSGATLKGYQLEGVAWMVGLYQNGISGILGTFPHTVFFVETDVVASYEADEMGLGKVRNVQS